MATIRNCIVKNSTRIRTLLKARFKEIKRTNSEIVEDARLHGRQITGGSLSRFLNKGNVQSTLSQEDIIWLCIRYGIEIQLMVGTPKAQPDGKIKLFVPPYDEENCLKYVKRFFHIEVKTETNESLISHTDREPKGS